MVSNKSPVIYYRVIDILSFFAISTIEYSNIYIYEIYLIYIFEISTEDM